ncbi:HATPase_UhpB-NarQ-NarX-like domain containing protein [Candidatus Nanopelagicaceae bacterium]
MNNERVALAQELHDGIAQDLVALGFSIDALISTTDSADTKSSLRSLRFTITELVVKVRNEIHSLRSDSELLESPADTDLAYELQRIFLEILRNVQEHSQATLLAVQVSDNGVGGAQIEPGSFGLAGIQERTEKLNGEIQIESSEEGTTIKFQIPLDR